MQDDILLADSKLKMCQKWVLFLEHLKMKALKFLKHLKMKALKSISMMQAH